VGCRKVSRAKQVADQSGRGIRGERRTHAVTQYAGFRKSSGSITGPQETRGWSHMGKRGQEVSKKKTKTQKKGKIENFGRKKGGGPPSHVPGKPETGFTGVNRLQKKGEKERRRPTETGGGARPSVFERGTWLQGGEKSGGSVKQRKERGQGPIKKKMTKHAQKPRYLCTPPKKANGESCKTKGDKVQESLKKPGKKTEGEER